MSTVTITNLPAAGALTGTELLPIVQNNVTSNTTTQDIADLAGGGAAFPYTGSAQITGSLGITGSLTFRVGSQPYNIAIGYLALKPNTTGNYNTAIGKGTLQQNTGNHNVAIGQTALGSNTSGNHNIAIGKYTLLSNVNGCNSIAIGDNALRYNTTGCNNTAIGLSALCCNTTANYNTAIGQNALIANTTGYGNIAIGDSTSTGNFNNSVILGRGATATCSNQFVVGSMLVNAGSVACESNSSTNVWNVVINGVARKILLA
jgi:hypothetical protein